MSSISKADITYFGLRITVGVIFLAFGSVKFDPAVGAVFPVWGVPQEMQIPVALAETVSGIVMIVGVLTRLSASLVSIIMLGAIFYVLKAASITGQTGVALPLLLLASCLVIIVSGPGKISVSHLAKRVPRVLQ